jgi:aspartyl-tRNA(Asn)/glutamyl-tRNA(Gln) amidotransferase subunit A
MFSDLADATTCDLLQLFERGDASPLEATLRPLDVTAAVFAARPPATVPTDAATMLAWTTVSHPLSLTQQPTCTMPCGSTQDGLPTGLQLVGPMFGDTPVLRAAHAFETLHPIARAPLPA